MGRRRNPIPFRRWLLGSLLLLGGLLALVSSNLQIDQATAKQVPKPDHPLDTTTPTATSTETPTPILTPIPALSPTATNTLPPAPCPPSWAIVPSPDHKFETQLYGVSAVSANDVWAVGRFHGPSNNGTLIEHWDGTKWS